MEGRALQPTAMRILDFYDRHPISESQVLDAVRRATAGWARWTRWRGGPASRPPAVSLTSVPAWEAPRVFSPPAAAAAWSASSCIRTARRAWSG